MRFSLFVVAAFCVSGLAAHASTMTYQINAPLSDGGLFEGTFTYNSTNVFASTLTATTTGSSSGANGTVKNQSAQAEAFPPGDTDIVFFENSGAGVNLIFPGSTFDGVLCTTTSTNCGGQPSVIGGSANFLGTTTVTELVTTSPSSVTPEPSSIALLSTGLLGVAGVMKRKLA